MCASIRTQKKSMCVGNVKLDISYVNEHLFLCTYIAFCYATEGSQYGKYRETLWNYS